MLNYVFDEFVQSTFVEFCSFLGINDAMSTLDIIYDDKLSFAGNYEETDSGHKITLNQKNLEKYTDHGKGILFHEFTHYYDHVTLVQSLSINERKALLTHYTEFHAAYIQMCCWCRFSSLYNTRLVTIADKIPHIEKEISIGDFYLKEANIAHNLTICYSTKNIENSYVNHMKRSMYYAGELWFAKKNCSFNIDHISDITLFTSYLGKTIEDLMLLFMRKEPIDEIILRKSLEYDATTSLYATCMHVSRNKYNAGDM